MDSILGFLSLTGELEKSNLLLNLAASLTRSGKKTLLVDLAIPVPSLDVLSGCAETVVYTAADVAAGRVALSRAVLPLPIKKGRETIDDRLFLLPSAPGDVADADACRAVLDAVRVSEDFDLALVWLSRHTVAREAVDGLFLLTDGDELSLRVAEAQAGAFRPDAFLLTGFSVDWDSERYTPPVLSVAERLGLPLLGIVPRLPTGLSGIVPSSCRTRAEAYVRAVRNVAGRFLGMDVPLLKRVPLVGMSRRRVLTRGE